jgi:hypothetical protein
MAAPSPAQGRERAKTLPRLLTRRDLPSGLANKGLKSMSAIGYSAPRARDFHISACADWRQEQLVFARQQSLAMRRMEWESRARPLKSWSSLMLPWAGAAMLALGLVTLLT